MTSYPYFAFLFTRKVLSKQKKGEITEREPINQTGEIDPSYFQLVCILGLDELYLVILKSLVDMSVE